MPESTFSLGFDIQGKGRNVVLLHGFLESHSMYDGLDLQQHFRVIRIDLPGHGWSSEVPIIESIHQMALCVQQTLIENKIEEFDLLGHSMGGYVALEYLSLFGLKGQLILLNSNYWTDDEKKQADRLRVANLVFKNKNLFIREAIPHLFVQPKNHVSAIENLVQEALQIPAEHIAACSIAMRNRKNHLGTLLQHAKKISVLQGESDQLCPLERTEKDVAGSEINFIVIPKAGHMSHLENTPLVIAAILDCLESTAN